MLMTWVVRAHLVVVSAAGATEKQLHLVLQAIKTAQAAKALADGMAAAAAVPARQLQQEQQQQALPPLQRHKEQHPPHGPLNQVRRKWAHMSLPCKSLC